MHRFAVYVILIVYSGFVVSDTPVGGCSGTEYGCCPDGVSSAKGLAFSGCGQRHVPTSPACQAYLDSLPMNCSTTTSCLDTLCIDNIQGMDLVLDFKLHKCRDPPSVNLTMMVPLMNYRWSHEFSGDTRVVVPNFQLPPNVVLAGFTAHILADVHVYKSNRDINFSLALEPFLLFSTSVYTISTIVVVDDVTLPVNTSDCYGPPDCHTNCRHCLEGDDGWVCYKCPLTCSGSSHPVCGNDIVNTTLVSYDSECAMRLIACEKRKALRIVYPGRCSLEPPTQLKLLTSWPTSLRDLPSETQNFIDGAVVFLIVSVNGISESMYTPVYFSDGLSKVVGYQVVVPEVTRSTNGIPSSDSAPGRRDATDRVTLDLNVTMYAHYHSSSGFEVIVPNTELVRAIQSNIAQLEEKLNVQFVSVDRSHTSQPSSSSTTVVVAVVVSIVATLASVAVLIVVYIWYQRNRSYKGEPTKEEVAYIPGQDELAIGSKTD